MQRAMAFDGERSTERANLRNGYRERLWETRAGSTRRRLAVPVDRCDRCEVLGIAAGPREAEPFWADFLRSLKLRGLRGVKLVISDAPEGLKAVAAKVLKATWQHSRVHWLRSAPEHAGQGQRQMVLAAINTALAQETCDTASTQWRIVADQPRAKFPKLAELVDVAELDVLALMTLLMAHRKQIHSTSPLQRVNAEIERRTDVVAILPHSAGHHAPRRRVDA